MQRLFRLKLLRELRASWLRYLALGLAITFAVYIVISLIGAADTVIIGTERHAEANALEDGQFTTFVPLSSEELAELEREGATVEPMFYCDYPLDDGSVLRMFRVRQKIDLIELEAGALPAGAGEIVLEKRYCEEHALGVGDTVSFAGRTLTISGVATSPDYDAPFREMGDSTVDSANFGPAFVTAELYDELLATGAAQRSEEYLYAYRLGGSLTAAELRDMLEALTFDPETVDDPYFQEYWDRTYGELDDLREAAEALADGTGDLGEALADLQSFVEGPEFAALRQFLPAELIDGLAELASSGAEISDGASDMRDAIVELLDEHLAPDTANLRSFVKAEDNPRIGGAADDVIINKFASILAGVIIIALLAYVISVFVVHTIECEQQVIGTLYALGVRRRELMRHYLLLPVLVCLVFGVVGTVLGYSNLGVPLQTADTYAYFSVPTLDTIVEVPVVLYGAVMPPLVAAAVNWIVIRRKLSAPPLKMIRNEVERADVSKVDLGKLGYVRRFQIRQLLREGRSALGVVLGIFVCLLLMMIGLNAWVLCKHVGDDNVEDTKYEYMYLYKYPEQQVPAGGHEAYAVTMKKEALGYNMDVTILGIADGNPYFEAHPGKSQSRVQISSAMAQKYGIGAGDTFTLSDEDSDRVYAFTVDEVVEYAPAFYVFMDIGSMRELFGMPDDYWNVVFADRDLNVDSGRLYSVSTREDVVKAADIFVNLMWSMVVTMVGASAVIMVLVMYLMMKVMTDHAAQNIALFKIFGYRKRELRRLFINGNTCLIVVGVLMSIPLSKVIMDAIYPFLVANVACAIDVHFEPWLYAVLFFGCLALYALIFVFLVRRIHRIAPNEVLKNRE